MKIYIIFLCLLPLWSYAFDAKRCDQFQNDCEYYSCIAEAKHCNRFSYPTNFGKRICLRYQTNLNQFSESGKMWVETVRKCLIHEMSTFEENLSCHGLRSRAFKSHVPCYIQNGYCDLSMKDKDLVMKAILPGLLNLEGIKNGIEVLKYCQR